MASKMLSILSCGGPLRPRGICVLLTTWQSGYKALPHMRLMDVCWYDCARHCITLQANLKAGEVSRLPGTFCTPRHLRWLAQEGRRSSGRLQAPAASPSFLCEAPAAL